MVGKTSIRKRYLGATFDKDYNVTLGADFAVKRMGRNVIQIWDLAGQPVYASVRSEYYSGAEGVILVFDITRQSTFVNVPKWLNEMMGVSNRMVPIVLVGNKVDLRGSAEQSINSNAGKQYAKDLTNWSGFTVPYIESSALTGENIDKIFSDLIKEIEIFKSTSEGY
jgi:small GTP-binding protein